VNSEDVEADSDFESVAVRSVPSVAQKISPHLPLVRGAQSSDFLSIGDVLKDRFILVDDLGEGGMGMVFKALDKRKQEAEDNDPFVAIKVLRPEMSADQKLFVALQRETKRAQQLSHPNIIRVYDFDRDGSHVFMSMEYLTGQTLSKLIKTSSPMPFAQAWPIIEAMGTALACAHQNQIVHCDFKPSNVFIKNDGTVKILDFGIASKFNANGNEDDGDRTRYNPRGLGALTEAYASLEMLKGTESPDPSDDIYAFGCVIYQLLTGKHPFSMLSAKQVFEFNQDPQNKLRKLLPTPIPGLPARQMDALLKALSLERSTRIKTIDELLGILNVARIPSRNRHILSSIALCTILGTVVWYNRDLLTTQHEVPKNLQDRVEKPVPSKPADDVIEHFANRTEPNPIENKQVLPDNTGQLVKLFALKPSYKIGEQLLLKFTLNKPMYVRMVHRGAKGKISDLLPNPFQPMVLLKANHDYFLPSKGAKYSIDIEGPVGMDSVTIFASETPIASATKLLDNDGLPTSQAKSLYSWNQIHFNIVH